MKPRSLTFWKSMALILLVVALAEFGILVSGSSPFLKTRISSTASKDDGFEAFESIAFAREFSERYQTFDARNFKATQTATAFLLDDETRAQRLAEIARLEEKIERRDVSQRARLMTLVKMPGGGERFRADLDVELSEGSGTDPVRSRFTTRLEFTLSRAERTAQNTWGFRVGNLRQDVNPTVAVEAGLNGGGASALGMMPEFALRPGVSALVRFPCSIENVELPKGTSVRVKLTTLDISELQMTTAVALASEQVVKAICRDRIFTMKVRAEDPKDQATSALVVLKSLTMESSQPLHVAVKASIKPKRKKTAVEKSIEDQLGFVVEEE